ncbi:MAG: FCD domain-containing protein [Anaerolineae bacterium]|nr:FCD domain-containing protein [Thermoflexales bacterium]MDW8406444.1 FCD domain-containing protein [Anaerolineae bacterium]
MLLDKLDSDLARYIIERGFRPGDRLPPLEEISKELEISIGKLREQLEVARSLGLVDVRPRAGIRLSEYSFLPAIRFSLLYALAYNPAHFETFSALRNHVESAFWDEAVHRLTAEDHRQLLAIVERAWAKLEGRPIHIPHAEHRALHMTIFGRLNNPFVLGLLEAYWEAYEAVGLNVFSDYEYLREVWTYHERIVQAIVAGRLDEGHRLLVEHAQLLQHREPARAGGSRARSTRAADSKTNGRVERKQGNPVSLGETTLTQSRH